MAEDKTEVPADDECPEPEPRLAFDRLTVVKNTSIVKEGIGNKGEKAAVPIKKGTLIADLEPAEQMVALVDVPNLVPIMAELQAEINRLQSCHYRCMVAAKKQEVG